MLLFRYHNTNCFFIRSTTDDRLLAVDAGWPCTLHEYARNMKAIGQRLDRISWAIVTHFHMDHAGLITDFMDLGVTCVIFENQEDTIDEMERIIMKSCRGYKKIDKSKLMRVRSENSESFFRGIGIHAKIVLTPGHSPDSISFVTDEHEAIIGDLYPFFQLMDDDDYSHHSYEILKLNDSRYFYPSHAEEFEI